jgi:zinc/manganese transport system ATP-binding protein
VTSVLPAARRDRGAAGPAAVSLRGAAVRFGIRTLWSDLDLDVAPGEFVAVLGPNGSGKTTLVKVLLGLLPLAEGEVRIGGHPPRRGSPAIGYVPQQKSLDADLPLRGRDLVGLGLDGHRWGLGLRGRAVRRARVDAVLAAVGGTGYADRPVGLLSGGEQQRLRVAQALVGDPDVLLCDEPLISLDLAHQRMVTDLVDARRRAADTAVLFVTHEINPVLPLADRVLYLVDGRFRIGPVDEVMTSAVLSELYRTDVDVLRVRDRLVVLGADSSTCHDEEHATWTG